MQICLIANWADKWKHLFTASAQSPNSWKIVTAVFRDIKSSLWWIWTQWAISLEWRWEDREKVSIDQEMNCYKGLSDPLLLLLDFFLSSLKCTFLAWWPDQWFNSSALHRWAKVPWKLCPTLKDRGIANCSFNLCSCKMSHLYINQCLSLVLDSVYSQSQNVLWYWIYCFYLQQNKLLSLFFFITNMIS